MPFGIQIVVGDPATFDPAKQKIFGALLQYPATDGGLRDPRPFIEKAHAAGALVVMAADILGLTLLTPPGELGRIARWGRRSASACRSATAAPTPPLRDQDRARPPHARADHRRLGGRAGPTALRMALQTREQHIRREKATSNICTAQALLAIISGMYAVYHGPKGLKAIAQHVHGLTALLARGLGQLGYKLRHEEFFDTVAVQTEPARIGGVLAAAEARKINLRRIDDRTIGISLDETTTPEDVRDVLAAFAGARPVPELEGDDGRIPRALVRQSAYLAHPVFNTHHSETEMLRYMRLLESRDLSLTAA